MSQKGKSLTERKSLTEVTGWEGSRQSRDSVQHCCRQTQTGLKDRNVSAQKVVCLFLSLQAPRDPQGSFCVPGGPKLEAGIHTHPLDTFAALGALLLLFLHLHLGEGISDAEHRFFQSRQPRGMETPCTENPLCDLQWMAGSVSRVRHWGCSSPSSACLSHGSGLVFCQLCWHCQVFFCQRLSQTEVLPTDRRHRLISPGRRGKVSQIPPEI